MPTEKPAAEPAENQAKKPPETPSGEPARVGAVDIEVFAHNLARMIEEGGKALAAYMKPREEGKIKPDMAEDVTDVVKTVGHVAEYWLSDPQRAIELQTSLGRAYLDLWAGAVRRMAGEPASPSAEPEVKDKRFADPEWSQNQFFDFLKQAYLLTSKWGEKLVTDADGIDEHTKAKAAFYVKQIANAISPSNFVLTNPELLRETLASNADNLVRGMHLLKEDIEAGHGNLKIRQSDSSKFAIGRNLALTPGKVVFQNDLMQLIQYTPTTPQVLKVPLLIVPPWINKFYILDLTPEKSFIKWCVDQGVTVFVVSWVNPDAHLAAKSFEQYMIEGPIAALDAIEQATGEKKVNAIGYCVGGTDHPCLSRRQEKEPRSVGYHVRLAGRLHPFRRPQGVRRRGTHPATRSAHEGTGLSRSLAHGERLQHAALERPDLALRGQQLSARQETVSLRHSLLEFRRHPHAGGQPFVLSAQLLSRKQAQPGRDGNRRRQARSAQGENPDLQSRHPRGPHRAGKVSAGGLEIFRRPGEICSCRLGSYRGRHQPAGQGKISVLDRQAAERLGCRPMAENRRGTCRLVVARLARLA
jgi:hypothetical protein